MRVCARSSKAPPRLPHVNMPIKKDTDNKGIGDAHTQVAASTPEQATRLPSEIYTALRKASKTFSAHCRSKRAAYNALSNAWLENRIMYLRASASHEASGGNVQATQKLVPDINKHAHIIPAFTETSTSQCTSGPDDVAPLTHKQTTPVGFQQNIGHMQNHILKEDLMCRIFAIQAGVAKLFVARKYGSGGLPAVSVRTRTCRYLQKNSQDGTVVTLSALFIVKNTEREDGPVDKVLIKTEYMLKAVTDGALIDTAIGNGRKRYPCLCQDGQWFRPRCVHSNGCTAGPICSTQSSLHCAHNGTRVPGRPDNACACLCSADFISQRQSSQTTIPARCADHKSAGIESDDLRLV